MRVVRSVSRGYFDHGWLKTFHSFRFGDYVDGPERFRSLRVINEDHVQPKTGFGQHGHRDMEILTLVLEGALKHRDSLGNGSIISPGEIQRMSAGRGILHSEANESEIHPVHLLQIWIEPQHLGNTPGYEQAALPDHAGKWALAAGPKAKSPAVTIDRDVELWIAALKARETLPLSVAADRYGWLQVATGQVRCGTETLGAGDALAIEQPIDQTITALVDSFILRFDLE